MKKHKHIVVGVSGGVDSSVAAALLKKEGHQVTGVFMKNWEGDDDAHCPAAQDLADAQSVCDKLGIPLQLVNFSNEYWERVFSFFLDEYRAGRTPNPDILCNKEIKFKAFLDYAKQLGADHIATGHYARRSESDINTQLLKGLDHSKDQSYFLHALNSDALAQTYFPVGALEKTEVRKIAAELGLKTHDKKDSTGICFIGERKFKTFLNEYLPAQPGDICTLEGQIIGRHDGLMFYTIGQRQGLQIGGLKGQSELPWYVAEKDLTNNRLIVVQGENHPALFKPTLIGLNPHWINEAPTLPLHATAKTRYRQPDQACLIEAIPGSPNIKVSFTDPQRAITPGQSVVFYQGEVCLGGAVIA
jgi:tRNA-specific 2-thiouridylase